MRTDPALATQRLAAFVAETSRTQHPEAAWHRARLAFLDTIGCILQGATTETGTGTQAAIQTLGAGPAPVIGTGRTAAAPWAALANGTAAHAMDLDDYTLVANDHPSAVMVPSLLAVADPQAHTLGDILDAYLIGLEVIFRVGAAINMAHYNLGWHTTSTIDGLGATAAVARLIKLDTKHTASALSLTVSMGAGMVSQFGTSAKPLHAGLSAKNGVLAASLAGQGLTGHPAVLDGPVSLSTLMVPAGIADFDTAMQDIGQSWGIETYGLGAKVYPSCGYTHRSIDAAIALHRRLGADVVNEIRTVHVSLPDFHLAILPYGVADLPNEALFSTAWCVATALAKGRNTLSDFTPAALGERPLRDLAARIEVTGRAPLCPELNVDPDDPDTVRLTFASGRQHIESCARWTGMPGADLTDEEFYKKFYDVLSFSYAEPPKHLLELPEILIDGSPETPIGVLWEVLNQVS